MRQTPTHRDGYVYISGMGAVTPFGYGIDQFQQSISSGKSGFSPISVFPAADHRTHIAGEVKHPCPSSWKRVTPRLLSRADEFALFAAKEALQTAALFDSNTGKANGPERIGIIVGTAAGGILGLETFFRKRFKNQPIDDPYALLSSFCLSAIATNIAKEFCITGERFTIATVCSSSALALAAAYDLIQADRMDTALVVGAESLSEVTHAGFNSLRSVDPDTCRPFDRYRNGLVLGEGAGAIILTKTPVKKAPSPTVAIGGYGMLTDLHHFTAPQPEGVAISQTISMALENAGTAPEDVDYVNAHGTGTLLNDAAECLGLAAVFKDCPARVLISSTKSMTGHALGAAGVLEAIAVTLCMTHGVIPPTANLETPEPMCDLDFVPQKARFRTVNRAVSNSFAFGGSNVSLVFQKSRATASPRLQHSAANLLPVITGCGVVSPLGIGMDAFSKAMNADDTGLQPLRLGDAWSTYIGGVVDMALVRPHIPIKLRRRLNQQASFLYLSVEEALKDAGIYEIRQTRQSMSYGSAFGCSDNVHRFYTQLLTDGPRLASPQSFNLSVTNAPAALVAQALHLSGPIWVFVSDETSFDNSLHWAAHEISTGKASQVIVCGAEEISESILAIHQQLGILKPENKSPFALGEGALCMVLEEAGSAMQRGATVYGRVLATGSAHDMTSNPLDFSENSHGLLTAADNCLSSVEGNLPPHIFVTPENGIAQCDHLSHETRTELSRRIGTPIRSVNMKRRVGESGFAGGMGLLAALTTVPPGTRILSLNTARGGGNTATLVETGH